MEPCIYLFYLNSTLGKHQQQKEDRCAYLWQLQAAEEDGRQKK